MKHENFPFCWLWVEQLFGPFGIECFALGGDVDSVVSSQRFGEVEKFSVKGAILLVRIGDGLIIYFFPKDKAFR